METPPGDGLAVDFVVESDRAQLGEIVQRVRDKRLRTNIGTVSTLDDAVAAFNPTERRPGKTIIRVRTREGERHAEDRPGSARRVLVRDALAATEAETG